LKIAISADGPNLDAKVGSRFGTSDYILILDPSTMDFEAVRNPGAAGQPAGGMQAVAIAISKEVKAVLTGYCSPHAKAYLSHNDIEVMAGLRGVVAEAIAAHCGRTKPDTEKGCQYSRRTEKEKKERTMAALNASARQLVRLMPIMASVILVLGLFNVFVSEKVLAMVFSGRIGLDALWGACLGSVFTGNAINSYIIGRELLEQGVGLVGVTALMVAWVSVGLVQLPVEMASLGRRFALVRNAAAFAVSLMIAILTVPVMRFMGG
jgi:predicted Fe-Mo cluster-binding NifX family protein